MTKVNKKDKPNFNVTNYGFMKSVKSRWRKPRGIDNKKRVRKQAFGKSPRVGYKNTDSVRGKHPSGKNEILVRNIAEFDALLVELSNAKSKVVDFVVGVAAGVGLKKRLAIEKKADAHKIHILNRVDMKKVEARKKAKEEARKRKAKKGKQKDKEKDKKKEKKEKKADSKEVKEKKTDNKDNKDNKEKKTSNKSASNKSESNKETDSKSEDNKKGENKSAHSKKSTHAHGSDADKKKGVGAGKK